MSRLSLVRFALLYLWFLADAQYSLAAEPKVIVDYNIATLPLNLIPKTSSIGFSVGVLTPWKIYGTLDIEVNQWKQKQDADTRYAKDGSSYSQEYSFNLYMIGGRYFFESNAKGPYVWAGVSSHSINLTVGQKDSVAAEKLSTKAIGPFIGGGYSFFEGPSFDVTLGGRIILAQYSGDKEDLWPKFEEQPDAHLINDVIKNPVLKGDITIGWRF